MNALDPAFFGIAKAVCELGRPAQVGDKFGISHETELNTMFSSQSNMACNNNLFSWASLPAMPEAPSDRHESLERLLSAVKESHSIVGPAALASALNLSDQRVTNWGTRGVSKQGAMKAQSAFGVSATWIQDGVGPRFVGVDPVQTSGATVTALASKTSFRPFLQALADRLRTMDKPDRESAAIELQHISMYPEDSEKYIGRLAGILGELPIATRERKVLNS